ncbi:MAG TPA: response regulator [Polyangiaceae bacterium]|jgi:CheY-like chemotaxis protein/predicted regulator of Ras-like GTPase activity (Roadblock/LC7/MglB family)|nr:response regulator [Polyangiaceae bacterium]
MASGSDKRRVLIVDDEEALAWSLSTRLGKVRPRYAVDTANDGDTALAKLREKPADLLVADVRMPGMSGIDLVLAALRLKMDLPVIVMTAFKTPDVQRLTDMSAIQFLEKPFEFERFLSLVDRSLASSDTKGFSGAISVQTLPDIVQLYVLSSATGALTIRHGFDEGHIWFEGGTIPHAATAGGKGDEAFFEIMLWSGGEFSMRIGAVAPERSVTCNWQELLLESCRRIDEERTPREERTSVEGWTLSPPSIDDADPFRDMTLEEPAPARLNATRLDTQEHDSKNDPKEREMNIKDSLAKLNTIDGFIGAALVDSESGMLLGQEGGGNLNLEVAAAGNTEVVRAKRKTMQNLAIKDQIEDILITLGKHYHLIRPLRARNTLFFYVALDRSRANLAMARIGLADVEKDLQV